MELRHIRYVLAVADHLNFTRAAAAAHVTQSTLSHQVRQLEDQLGLRLFERSARGVQLTEAGRVLLPTFRRALRDIDAAIRSAKDMRATLSGELRVGLSVGPAFMVAVAPRIVADFNAAFPAVDLRTEEVATDRMAQDLMAGELDLGIGDPPFDHDALAFEPLFREELVLVVGPGHPLAHRRRVRMIELHRQKLALVARSLITRATIDRCFAAADIRPTIVAEVTTVDSLFEFARASGLAALVLRNTAERLGGFEIVRIDDPTPLRTVGVVYRAGAETPPPIRAYADTAAGVVRAIADADGWPWLDLP